MVHVCELYCYSGLKTFYCPHLNCLIFSQVKLIFLSSNAFCILKRRDWRVTKLREITYEKVFRDMCWTIFMVTKFKIFSTNIGVICFVEWEIENFAPPTMIIFLRLCRIDTTISEIDLIKTSTTVLFSFCRLYNFCNLQYFRKLNN